MREDRKIYEPRHVYRHIEACANPDRPDSTTPKFAFDHLHIQAVSNANGGMGFPFVQASEIHGDPRPPGGLRGLLATVARDYSMTAEELLSPRRSYCVSHPRQDFMWRARQVKWPDGAHRYSLPFIAGFLGFTDHTTILHGVRAHQARLDAEASG